MNNPAPLQKLYNPGKLRVLLYVSEISATVVRSFKRPTARNRRFSFWHWIWNCNLSWSFHIDCWCLNVLGLISHLHIKINKTRQNTKTRSEEHTSELSH